MRVISSSRSFRRWLCVAAALLATNGCGKDDKTSSEKAANDAEVALVPTVPDTALVAGKLADVAAPADVLAFGGLRNIDQIVAKVQSIAPGGAQATPSIAPAIAQKLGLKGGAALDLSKPVRLAMFDPRGKERSAFVFAVKSREALVESLPATKKVDEQGNAYGYGRASDAFLNFVGDFAVFTHAADTFANHRDFFARFAGADLPEELAVRVRVKALMDAVGGELAQGLAELERLLRQQAPNAGDSRAAAGVAGFAKELLGFAKDVDEATVTASLAEGILGKIVLRPIGGSPGAAAFADLAGRPHQLYARYPAGSPFVASFSGDPDKALGIVETLSQLAIDTAPYAQATRDKLLELNRRFVAASSGEFAIAAHPVTGTEGLALTGVVGLRDAAEMRRVTDGLADILKDPSMVATYEKVGAKLVFEKHAYKVGDVWFDTSEVKLDADKVEQLGPQGAFVAGLFQMHFGIGKDAAYFGYGRDAKAALEALVGGKLPPGLDKDEGVVRAFSHAAPQAFALLYVKPIDVVRALAGVVPGERSKRLLDGLALLPSSPKGVSLALGVDDGALVATLDLPAEQLAAIAQLAMLQKIAAMGGGQMPSPMMPPWPKAPAP